MVLRQLTRGDIAQAARLSSAAGWNQTSEDWARLLRLAPQGCFGIEEDGRVAATATALCYGTDLAWVGMVLTAPEYRRRGFARTLMLHALQYLDAQDVPCVKLDATDLGRPLYEQLGFVAECPIERWFRTGRMQESIKPASAAEEIDFALDRQAFGVNRVFLRRELAGIESAGSVDSFAMARAGSEAA